MKRFFTLTILTVALAAMSAFGATITPFTNSTAFGTAVAAIPGTGTVTEGFNTSSSSIFQITFNIHLLATSPTTRGISGGSLLDEADSGRQQNTVISLLNGGPIYAVSGLWDLTPNGAGSGLRILLNFVGGGTQTLTQILGPTGGGNVGNFTAPFFFGFTSDQAISSFQILPAGSVTETFRLDNLTVATNVTIPEPSTFGLMGLALIGLGAFRSRRK